MTKDFAKYKLKTKMLIAILLLYLQSFLKISNACISDPYYTAGTVEFEPESRTGTPNDMINANLNAYLVLIDQAKAQNVDILVFPEGTLNYHGLYSRKEMLENAIEVPNPEEKIAPYNIQNSSNVLKKLSQKCKDKQIYVLVNLIEKVACHPNEIIYDQSSSSHNDGHLLYNTNVVFNRQGQVISKYRKFNLFIEPTIDQPINPDYAIFTTDFGVKFGHFICFDIMFKEPAMNLITMKNITHILFSTMWFSELPFLTSEQMHQSWAYANNIVFIGAGASRPSVGSSGSGIYIGRQQIAKIIMSPKSTRKLLISKVPKVITTGNNYCNIENKNIDRYSPIEMQGLKILEDWIQFNTLKVDIKNQIQTICVDENICCVYDIKLKINEIPPKGIAYEYMLVSNYTTRVFGISRKCGELYCSIIACQTKNPKSCGKRFKNNENLSDSVHFQSIKIQAKVKLMDDNDMIIMPNTLDTSILPLDVSEYNFNESKIYKDKGSQYKDYEISSNQELTGLLTFGIYGRNFALDENLGKNKNKVN